jgi:hypothetical protein
MFPKKIGGFCKQVLGVGGAWEGVAIATLGRGYLTIIKRKDISKLDNTSCFSSATGLLSLTWLIMRAMVPKSKPIEV